MCRNDEEVLAFNNRTMPKQKAILFTKRQPGQISQPGD
jgi:hypothetical protein